MPKRPQAGSAAAGSDADAKKAKPHVHVSSHAIAWPPDTEPETSELNFANNSKREARTAKQATTSETMYRNNDDYPGFAKLFDAALASTFAKEGRLVTLTEVITEMRKMTKCEPRFARKSLKDQFAWRGFARGEWQISRRVRFYPSGHGMVAFPKGTAMPGDSRTWKFSPLPGPATAAAARHPPVEMPCENSRRSGAGCVVC